MTDSNSTSYASGDEDETGDDCMSLDGFDASEDGDGGVSDTYREIRRVNSLSSRLGRKLDLYQDAIQRLEKELQTTQDELETSSAATKFAEFQLQQLRTMAADEEAKQNQAEDELRKKLEDLEQTVRFQRGEMSKVLNEKAADDARALEHEQEVARREVERLEHSLRSSSDSGDNDNDKEEMTSALQAAQKRIEDLEREIETSQQSPPLPRNYRRQAVTRPQFNCRHYLTVLWKTTRSSWRQYVICKASGNGAVPTCSYCHHCWPRPPRETRKIPTTQVTTARLTN